MNVIDWLLEGDPSIRWQVMADLLGEPASKVSKERSRVAAEGWGRRLLDLQEPDGQWGGGFYSPKWVSTTYTLLLMRHLGVDSTSDPVQLATNRLIEGGRTWRPSTAGGGGAPFFEYRGETCVTAMNLALKSYFVPDAPAGETVEYLLDQQMSDGGWNCQITKGSKRSSFHTTISTLEGLLEYEGSESDPSARRASAAARAKAHDYLLDRRMMRSLRTGEIIDKSWTRFSFPPRWWYDVLRGLDYLQAAGVGPDDRWGEALDLLDSKRTSDGRWKLQNHHAGREHFRMEEPGQPSRWNTLRARRVLAGPRQAPSAANTS